MSQSDINGLVFVMATEYVYVSCETGNGILHKLVFVLISYCKSFNTTEILQLIALAFRNVLITLQFYQYQTNKSTAPNFIYFIYVRFIRRRAQ